MPFHFAEQLRRPRGQGPRGRRLLKELPGILNRLIQALRAHHERAATGSEP